LTRPAHPSLADAAPTAYWLDRGDAPAAADPLRWHEACDLAVIGGGYTGLWAALLAKEANPDWDVLVVEAATVGSAASGRNGGFCAASLTHGLSNGRRHAGDELAALDRLGRANLDAIAATIAHYGIDCDFTPSGALDVATAPHQVAWLHEDANAAHALGHDVAVLDRDQVRDELDSPTYHGGAWHRDTTALVDPARLAWGLRAASETLGVRFVEHTRVRGLRNYWAGVRVLTESGPVVRAPRVVLATNAFPAPLRRLRRYLVPVYDYALMSEPLDAAQLAALGWRNRQGVGDLGNQFHYYRLTADNRILWGGYDAIYHWANRIDARLEQRPATFDTLAGHFFATFPQLDGLRFSHAWGGVIDTCSRFFAFQGTAMQGRVAYSLGYTGLGVAASRFGAAVALDLLGTAGGEASRLGTVTSRPVPFPPEPLRYAGIQLTRRALAHADANDGRRGAWLRLLDRVGLGYDS
jgi:glycine/D-amino acid oxidase-like deaminating enzyme